MGKVVARAAVVVTSVFFVFLLAPGLVAASSAALTIAKPVAGESVASSTPAFAGTTSDTLDSITVSIYAGGAASGTPVQTLIVLSPVAESWEVAAESSLVDREYTVVAEQAGETSAAVTFTVDVPPPVVTVNPVAAWTKDSTPPLEGSAGDSASVEVTVEGPSTSKGAAVLSGGSWSYTPLSELADGAYTARALGKDSAGNVGESSTVTFTVDTVAPSVTLESVSSPTKETTPTLKGGVGVATGDVASVEVMIYEGTHASGTAAIKGAALLSGGSWTYTPTSALANGSTYTAQAVQDDEAGNVGKSAPVTFTVDTTPPVVTVNSAAKWTKDSTPTLGGSAGDSASVEVMLEGPSASKVAAVLSGGNWSYTPGSALPDGTYTARAVGKDLAGNVGESSAVTFTVDTVAPAVTLESVASPSNDTTPTLKGSAGVAAGDDASVEVAIYSVASGTAVSKGAAVLSGANWSYKPVSALSEGTYTAQAVQEDEAGNVGQSTITFRVVTAKPVVTIQSIASPTRATEPALSGSAGDSASVEARVFEGSSPSGTVASSGAAVLIGGSWSYTPSSALADGTYTAQAFGLDKIGNEGKSSAVTFTVDTTPPALTLTSPTSGALLEVARPTFSGQAGTATGDRASVRLTIYSGASASGSTVQTLEVASSGSSWTSGSNGPTLANGIYTVVAEQLDEAGNVSRASATFAVAVPTPSPPSPPTASFQWFPAAPHVGEKVSLVSTSSDAGSPITGFSWALAPGLALTPGEHVLTTTFSTPGSHVVRLRVLDANGLASEAAETIPVSAPEVPLMQPFPVVRIAGSAKTSSVKISLFTVLAPVGAKVSVSCHGHGCPTKRQSFVVAARRRSHGSTMLVSLTRFERSLDVGAVLEVRISKAGEIGKYTRFTVRRGKLPTRLDGCLSTRSTPMTCPST
ncbi:MAG TPA: Ig-like domain-containing protein [Solirubrobacteraceae bacterium]|nr:Ig-like domain-containing protein [Solirubrobacteraceae bacterium]